MFTFAPVDHQPQVNNMSVYVFTATARSSEQNWHYTGQPLGKNIRHYHWHIPENMTLLYFFEAHINKLEFKSYARNITV